MPEITALPNPYTEVKKEEGVKQSWAIKLSD